jgi:protein PhnA
MQKTLNRVYFKYMETLDENEDEIIVRDANSTILADGDSIILVKDLKLKGSSIVIKKGTKAKNIRLTDDEELIECNIDGMKGIVLRTEFIKKA